MKNSEKASVAKNGYLSMSVTPAQEVVSFVELLSFISLRGDIANLAVGLARIGEVSASLGR